jgi:hypothetical protein
VTANRAAARHEQANREKFNRDRASREKVRAMTIGRCRRVS